MKPKQKKLSKPTLSDKIADALTVKPRADIEDDHVFHTKPKTITRADLGSSDTETEATISDFRRRNAELLSEVSKKYEGQVVSRRDLHTDSDNIDESDSDSSTGQIHDESAKEPSRTEESPSDGEESDNYSITKLRKQLESGDEDESDAEGSDDEGGSGEDEGSEDEGEGYDISQMEEPIQEEFNHLKKQNVSEEAKKGNCVRNQLLLWEGLLEMRIHLQRCMNTANRMPMSDYHQELKKDSEFTAECMNTVNDVATVLEKFLSLQNMLFKNFPETKAICSKKDNTEAKQETKEDSDEEIPSDSDNEEIPSDTEPEDNNEPEKKETLKKSQASSQKKRKHEDYESDLATTHKAFKSFRDTTIQKWNDKTRLATAANIKNAPTNTILQQISYILSDRNKLIRRTQLKRSEYDILGYKNPSQSEVNNHNGDLNPVTRDRKDNDEYIPEIFDDSDFYHQLLRELIECKSADISDPVQLSRQWIALQQMRSKMKRKVDTKATKGRKIKYVVHNKLVNFMAPEKSLTWNEESANELYSSLFGKMFEQNSIGVNGNIENGIIKI